MAPIGRAALVRLIRAELADCEPEAARADSVVAQILATPTDAFYSLNIVRAQFHRGEAANWRDFARRLRDLLAEMGES